MYLSRLRDWPYGRARDYSGGESGTGSTYLEYTSSMDMKDIANGYTEAEEDIESQLPGTNVSETPRIFPTLLNWLKRFILGSTVHPPEIF